MDFEQAADNAPRAPGTVARFNELIKEAESLNAELIEIDTHYAQLMSRYNFIISNEIPKLMVELQTKEWVNDTGTRVRIKDYVGGGLPKGEEERAAAIKWLEENGGAEIIKSELVVPFSKSQHNQALAITDDLKQEGYAAILTSSVHAKNLQSLGLEKLKRGEELPIKMLGLFVDHIATIDHPVKAPKQLLRKKGKAPKKGQKGDDADGDETSPD